MKQKIKKNNTRTVLRLKNALVLFASLDKPQKNEYNEKTKEEYKLSIALQRKTPNYKIFLEACKSISESLTERQFRKIMIEGNAKLGNLSDYDFEHNSELDESFKKTQFKASLERPPKLYDFTSKRVLVEKPDLFIGGGDKVDFEATLFLGNHPKAGYYISSYISRVALVEKNSLSYDDSAGWIEWSGATEEEEDVFVKDEEKDGFVKDEEKDGFVKDEEKDNSDEDFDF